MAFASEPTYRQGLDVFIETGVDAIDRTPTWYAPMMAKPHAPSFEILATRGTAYNREIQGETLGQGHWVEPGTANRRTSFLIDPPDGRLPPLTEEGKRLQATKRSSYIANQSYDWVTDFDTWDRCITRGMPGAMMPSSFVTRMRMERMVRKSRLASETVKRRNSETLRGPNADGRSRSAP